MLRQLNDYIAKNSPPNLLDPSFAALRLSDRPDLSDFQANGAFQAAKILKRSPMEIADDIRSYLESLGIFSEAFVSGPGFVNVRVSDSYLWSALNALSLSAHSPDSAETLILDYGGPNVAKPLHVGHLRSAVIGQALKSTARHLGCTVISDVHLGDWGTPMGMLIAYLEEHRPDWPFFSETRSEECDGFVLPIDVSDLNKIYPAASALFKADTAFADRAREATAALQAGRVGYSRLWQRLVDLSVLSVKQDFARLKVDFDLWQGESDAAVATERMFSHLQAGAVSTVSDGALVIDVSESNDSFDIPPLILQKRDGALTYGATDLATIVERMREIHPDHILYVVDSRQSLHFTQVFRAAMKAGFAQGGQLEHIGFGTVNGIDGKPFKTREGGVMRLSQLLDTAERAVADDCNLGWPTGDDELDSMVRDIALAAVKFGDLSSIRTSDYIFDVTAFTRLEGKTGPYLQYTATRAESLLCKANFTGGNRRTLARFDQDERALAIAILAIPDALQDAHQKRLPSIVCDFAYSLANSFNRFYHNCPVLSEPDEEIRLNRLDLVDRANRSLRVALSCLGIPVPKRMLRAHPDKPQVNISPAQVAALGDDNSGN